MTISLDRGPQTWDELYWLVRKMWGITIPRHKVCPEHDAPFDAFATAYFGEDRAGVKQTQLLVHGSRGLSGKSRLMSVLGITKAALLGSDVNILGGSLSQSENIHDTMREAWESEHAPRYLVKTENSTRVRLHNDAVIRPLTASQKTVRGPHPPTLLLDEIDEMDYDIYQAALGQPMPQTNAKTGMDIEPFTAMSSTWQYPDKTFSQVIQQFRELEKPIFTWCYRDTSNPIDGWLSLDFVEQKKREIPTEMWRVEYELGEPSIGSRAFDPDSIERMFANVEAVEKGKVKKTKEFEEYVFEEYGTAEDYVISADWAKEQDFTVISVWNCTVQPARLVHYMRMRRLPYPVMIGHYNKMMQRWRAEGIHDATGLGGVVSDYIDDRAHGFKMIGEQRSNMLSNFVAAVENDKVRAPQVMTAYLAHKYCSVENMYRHGTEFHLPDEVCSFALAWHLIARRPWAADPVVLPYDASNYISEGVKSNTKIAERWVQGEVRKVSEDPETSYELMV